MVWLTPRAGALHAFTRRASYPVLGLAQIRASRARLDPGAPTLDREPLRRIGSARRLISDMAAEEGTFGGAESIIRFEGANWLGIQSNFSGASTFLNVWPGLGGE